MVVCVLGALGCEQRREVAEQMQDLKQAEERSPEVAQELRQEVEQKKQEVARLEEKLARAERGVTDEVLEERKELKEAMQRNEERVTAEVKEAQREAKQHNVQADQAKVRLEETKAPEVEARVNTETTVKPGSSDVELQRERREIAVETEKMREQPSK
jgi:gas vesicle protein